MGHGAWSEPRSRLPGAVPFRAFAEPTASSSEACLPEGYYFALDAFPLLRIHLDLGLIQHHCDAREPANGEGGIFEIGCECLVVMSRFRMTPKPLREGEKPTGRHFGRTLTHRALPTWAVGFGIAVLVNSSL